MQRDVSELLSLGLLLARAFHEHRYLYSQGDAMQPHNHTVLITGGSSGIGLALAQVFAQHNNSVIITGRNAAKLAHARSLLPNVITEQADMNTLADLERLAERYPQVNVLINNAGIQYNYEFADQTIPLERIESELQTNVLGPLMLTKLMLPNLLQHAHAAIVNVSSGLGFVPKESAPVYCATKAAMHSFTQVLRWQLEKTPINVFELIPPLTDTPMTAGRGRSKVAPEAVAQEFWQAFQRNRYEIRAGRSKILLQLQRFVPRVAEKIMRPGL